MEIGYAKWYRWYHTNIDIKNNSGNDKYDKYVIKQVDYKSNFIVVRSGKCW